MSAPFDLTTLAGIEACLVNSILPAFKNAFDEAGAFGMAVAIIATRFEGKGLASPRSTPAAAQLPPLTNVLGQAWLHLLRLLPYSGPRSVGQREVLQFIKDDSGVILHAISEHFKVTPNAISGIINRSTESTSGKPAFLMLRCRPFGSRRRGAPGTTTQVRCCKLSHRSL